MSRQTFTARASRRRRRPLGVLVWLGVLALFVPCRAEMIVINEIMYHPPADLPEYFVLSNQTTTVFDLSGWRVSDGVTLAFPTFNTNSPSASFLAGHESIVLTGGDPARTRQAYSFAPSLRILGPWQGKLSNEGERLSIQDKNGVVVTTVKYGTRGPRWPAAPQGTGHALCLENPSGRNSDWPSWTWDRVPRSHAGKATKSPGNRAPLRHSPRLNEIAVSNDHTWIELYNPLPEIVSVEGFRLSQKADASDALVLHGQIAPGGFQTFETRSRTEATVFLFSPEQVVVDAVSVDVTTEHMSWQAFPDGTSEWYPTTKTTRDSANDPDRTTDVVINEIMYRPPAAVAGGEFLELFNRSNRAVDLSGWELREAVSYRIPQGTVIQSGGFLVVVPDVAQHERIYGAGTIPLVGGYKGRLSAAGETVRLVDQRGALADEVTYYGGGEWPALARGGGSSLELRNPSMDNDHPAAWLPSREEGSFQWFSVTNTFLRSPSLGLASDDQELMLYLVGDGQAALKNVGVWKDGTNFVFVRSKDGSGQAGWSCQGNHAASYFTNDEFHLCASGRGDNRANHVETDLPGIVAGQTYELRLEARWISGHPRLIAQTWDDSIAGSFLLATPLTPGTPGRTNSCASTLVSPQLSTLRHSPVVPVPGDPVQIQVETQGSIGRVELCHRLDTVEGTNAWVITPMIASKVSRPTTPGGQHYAVTLNDYRKSGQLVQFFVRATNPEGAEAFLPAAGQKAPALFLLDDRRAPQDLRAVRLLVSAHDLDAIAEGGTAKHDYKYPRLSNQDFNATVIRDERAITYGASIRNSGSAITRRGQVRKPKVSLPPEQPYRGRTKFTYDDDAEGGLAYHNRVVRYLLYLLNQPANENEFVRLAINQGDWKLRDETEPVGNEFVERVFPDGKNGELYKIDDQWWFSDGGEGPQRDADWEYRGPDPARYRHNWAKRNQETQDDYTRLIDFFRAASETNSSPAQLETFLDAPAVLSLAAVRGYIGDWDNFTMQRGRNGYFYRKPDDGRYQLLHWDSDEGFVTGQPLYGRFIQRWVEEPQNRARFVSFVRQLIGFTVDEPLRFQTWLQLERNSVPESVRMATYTKFFQTRAGEVRKLLDDLEQLTEAKGAGELGGAGQ